MNKVKKFKIPFKKWKIWMIIKIKINYKKKTATGNFNEELNSIDQSKKKNKK